MQEVKEETGDQFSEEEWKQITTAFLEADTDGIVFRSMVICKVLLLTVVLCLFESNGGSFHQEMVNWILTNSTAL